MRNPAGTIIGTLIVFFAAILISLNLSVSSTKEVETSSFRLSVTMPAGTTLEKTDAFVTEIEQTIAGIPEKGDIMSRIEEGDATLTINLADKWYKTSKRTLPEIKNDILEKTKNLRTGVITMNEIS